MNAVFDRVSPPGSWMEERLASALSITELREIISELRHGSRCAASEMEAMRARIATLEAAALRADEGWLRMMAHLTFISHTSRDADTVTYANNAMAEAFRLNAK